MTYLVPATFALFAALAASAAAADNDEASISQMSDASSNPAFVQQLPETAVVPVPGSVAVHPKAKRPVPKTVAKRSPPVHSIFPNVGRGVAVTADGNQPVHLPTVGAGATQSL